MYMYTHTIKFPLTGASEKVKLDWGFYTSPNAVFGKILKVYMVNLQEFKTTWKKPLQINSC